ncbi:MAG: putative motility protein [Lachnospiraceae bacterium]|nr:putative motility protein [Lachnospiraceae bacterium]
MDIAGVSMALARVSEQSQIGAAVLKKAMDTNVSLGEGMVEMLDAAAAMERSVYAELGANIDIRI